MSMEDVEWRFDGTALGHGRFGVLPPLTRARGLAMIGRVVHSLSSM